MSEKKLNENKKMKVFISVFIGFVTIFVFMTISHHIEKQKVEEQIAREEVKKEKEKKQQQEIMNGIEKILAEDTKYESYVNEYKTHLKENDLSGAYDVALKAYDEAKRLESLYSTYNPPKDTPEYMLTLFEGAGSELSVAYAVRSEAFALVMKYLETQEEVDLKNAQSKFTESEEYRLSGIKKLEIIKERLSVTNNAEK